MSHINRREFIKNSATLVGAVVLALIVRVFPVPVTTPPLESGTYEAIAESLVTPILQEIGEASVMRKIVAVR